MPPRKHARTDVLRIAVLEDEDVLREKILLPALRDFGFQVTGAASAGELYRHLVVQQFDIILLDIGLPDEDGISVARHLRSTSNVGLVMLTGNRGREDRIRALQESVDAFLSKPVDIDVLGATLHSLARRLRLNGPATVASGSIESSMPAGPRGWQLEAGGWRLISPGERVVALTVPEHDLLLTLMSEIGRPVARETLIEALTRNIYDFDPHRLEMMVHRLRRKVEKQTGEALPLLTARGTGYLFAGDTGR